jgi:hypothetical protein
VVQGKRVEGAATSLGWVNFTDGVLVEWYADMLSMWCLSCCHSIVAFCPTTNCHEGWELPLKHLCPPSIATLQLYC